MLMTELTASSFDAGFNGSGAVQMVYAEKLFDKFPIPDVFFGLHVIGLTAPQGSLHVVALVQ